MLLLCWYSPKSQTIEVPPVTTTGVMCWSVGHLYRSTCLGEVQWWIAGYHTDMTIYIYKIYNSLWLCIYNLIYWWWLPFIKYIGLYMDKHICICIYAFKYLYVKIHIYTDSDRLLSHVISSVVVLCHPSLGVRPACTSPSATTLASGLHSNIMNRNKR